MLIYQHLAFQQLQLLEEDGQGSAQVISSDKIIEDTFSTSLKKISTQFFFSFLRDMSPPNYIKETMI